MAEKQFRIAYAPGLRQLLGALGCGPRFSGILVTDEAVRVWLGWSFQATIPRSVIASADLEDRAVTGVGVHGWRGSWLVNGSPRDLVRIQLGVGVRARVLGVRVPLTTLTVSVDEREEFVRLIRPKVPGPGTNGRVARTRRIRLPSPGLKPGLARDAHTMTSTGKHLGS